MNRAAFTATLAFFSLCLITVHAEKPPGRMVAVLEPFVKDQVLAGAVTLVASKDRVLDVSTVGYADIAAKKPMAADSVFWIASMSKPVTAAALMILVDEGKVDVNAPVEKYLPEFKGQMVIAKRSDEEVVLKKPVHPILVRNVLNHTSGLPFKSALEVPVLDMVRLETAVRSHAMTPLEHEPDSKYMYSNAGINTAGRIIEVVSGMKYEDFLQKRLFEPLGMKETTFWPDEAQVARVAKSYKPNKDKTALEEMQITQLTYPLTNRDRQPMPGGGLFSTAADVARFGQMLLNGGMHDGKRVLSEAAVNQMTSRQTPENLPTSYGFGFAVQPDSYGHGGAHATNLTVHPGAGVVTVFMVQHSGWRTDAGKTILPAFQKAALGLVK